MKKILKILSFLFLSVTLAGCNSDSNASLSESDNVVSIGLVLPDENYSDVYKIATEDIKKLNSSADINLEICYDEGDYTKGLSVTQDLCNNDSVIGVVGHMNTDLCLALKNTYEDNKLPLLVPTIDSNELIDSNEYIYQTLPDMTSNSRLFTTMAYIDESIDNVVIIYSDSQYGNEFSKILEQSLIEDKVVTIADKVCSPDVYKDIPDCIQKWKALDVDTVFLVGDIDLYQHYAPFIKNLNQDIKIYSTVDYQNLYLQDRNAYPYYNDVYQFATTQVDYNDELEEFYKKYNDKFGFDPNSDDVQIYDNIMIMAKAIADNNVRSPEELKNFLDNSEDIGSICGDNICFEDNKISNKICFIQSFNEDGTLSYSLGFTNNEINAIWDDYYSSERIEEYERVGDYSNEK